jgi:hypothetical protein
MEANAILTFRDEDGREWLAAAHIGPLLLNGKPGERLEVPQLKDRAFMVSRFTVVIK